MGPGAGSAQVFQLGQVVQVFEEHLHGGVMVLCKSKKVMALLRPHGSRR